MIERAEFPVQRNRTLYKRWSAKTHRSRDRFATRPAACHPRLAPAGAIAVVDALTGRQKIFPGDAGRIVDPQLLRLGVTTACLPLLDNVAAGFVQPRINLL